MSTYNMPLLISKKKITLYYPKSAGMGFFPRDSKKSLKQAISVQATEVLLYNANEYVLSKPLCVPWKSFKTDC